VTLNLPHPDAATQQMRLLADFRYALRRFLQFSEQAAVKVGLHPQQHQLLLQVAGASEGVTPTVAYIAERLGLRHHSVVELSIRCEEAGLIRRAHDPVDRRCVVLRLTLEGSRLLENLSRDHARELNELGPQLVASLKHIRAVDKPRAQAGATESA
jgi:DNA-binding MarR family transcriptional regulator